MSYFNSNVFINVMLTFYLVSVCRFIVSANYIAAGVYLICATYWLVKKHREQEQN